MIDKGLNIMRVMASFDDGTVEDLRALDLLIRYEIPAIFYFPVYSLVVNEQQGRNSLSPHQRRQVAKEFPIGSHTLTHPMLTRIPMKIAEHEIKVSKQMLEEEFGRPIESFCYPRGYANDELRGLVKEAGYKNARNTLVGNISDNQDPYWITPTVHICGKRRKEYEDTTWLDEAKRLLTEAVNEDESIYHLWGHSWEISKYDGWHDFEELLKEINESSSGKLRT